MVIALVGGMFAKFRIKRPKDTDSECLFPRRAEAQVVFVLYQHVKDAQDVEQQSWQELVLLCWALLCPGCSGRAGTVPVLPCVPVQHLLIKYTTAEWTRLATPENCKSLPGISVVAGWLCHAEVGLGTVLTIFSEVVTMSHFPAKSMSQAARLSLQGRGQLHGLLQNVSCLKKIKLSCWLLQRNFLQASNLSLLCTRLVRS